MPIIYQFLVALMNDKDVVVQLTATIAFKIGTISSLFSNIYLYG